MSTSKWLCFSAVVLASTLCVVTCLSDDPSKEPIPILAAELLEKLPAVNAFLHTVPVDSLRQIPAELLPKLNIGVGPVIGTTV